MATKLVKATSKSKKFQHSTMLHDSDSPLELFQEVAALNAQHGLTMKDWDFTLHNYNAVEIGKYDWKNAHVTVTLGALFG